MINNLICYRSFILGSVKREFYSRYNNSLLGALWAIINPLAMIVVYTLIFSKLMNSRLPGVDNGYAYGLYIFSGVMCWSLFTEIVTKSITVFIDNSNIIKKISFPKVTLPIIIILGSMITFIIMLMLFIAILFVVDLFPGLNCIYVLPLIIVQIIFSIGIGMFLGLINVFHRDVSHLFAVCLQFWFWLTPIVYPLNVLPPSAIKIVEINPLLPIVSGFHSIFIEKSVPDLYSLLYPFSVGVIICYATLYIYRKNYGDIVDEL